VVACRQCCRCFEGTCCLHLQGKSVYTGELLYIHIALLFWERWKVG
jgi:hypothetical protein